MKIHDIIPGASILIPVLIKLCNKLGIDYTGALPSSFKNEKDEVGIGGAISVDRQDRLHYDKEQNNKNKKYGSNNKVTTYWPNEPIQIDDAKLESLHNIDVIFTHSSPNFCEPLTKIGISYFIENDPQLLDDCSKERNDLTYIYDKLSEQNKLSRWFYGHFHKHYRTEKDYTTFIGLGELELKTGI